MSELAWSSERLHCDVAPVGIAQYVKERIRHASRELGWSYSRTRDVWYADERVSIKPRELRDIEGYTGVRYGRQELSEVDALLSKADALLAVGQDEDFAGPFVAAVRALVSIAYRAGAKGRSGVARAASQEAEQ